MNWRYMGSFTDSDGKTVQVKAIQAMMPLSWENVEDYAVAIPDHLEPHRGHIYVSVAYTAFGWDFSTWRCGNCNEGSK